MSMLDWQPAVEKLHELFPFQKVLEFGLGDGTQWFLDHCDEVHSIELHANPQTQNWYPMCLERYKDNKNWHPEFFSCDGDMQLTDSMKDYICGRLFNRLTPKNFDLIFVDPGVHCRGDITNLCYDHARVIAVHDTNVGHQNYGWAKMEGKGYYRIDTTWCSTEGVTFWIKDKELYDQFVELLNKQ